MTQPNWSPWIAYDAAAHGGKCPPEARWVACEVDGKLGTVGGDGICTGRMWRWRWVARYRYHQPASAEGE